MKKVLMLIVISTSLFACKVGGSDREVKPKGPSLEDRVIAKVHKVPDADVLKQMGEHEQYIPTVEVRYIHPMYQKGDLVNLNGTIYEIDSIGKQ